jgi:hypothetical protein
MTLTVDAPATAVVTLNTTEWDAAGVASGAHQLVTLNPGDTTLTLTSNNPFSANTAFFGIYIFQGGVGAPMNATAEISWKCQPSSAPPSPCCPPDPIATGLLTQVLQAVTLLQRQLVPFAYISSTAHAGLTGQGTIAVQGLLGLRIDLTTMPASLTQDASTPPFVFNVGWVSMEDSNGFIDETRAHAQHQNWFSRIASEATLIGYSFAPGVVATITELQREP